ncbi:hypothetical protein ACLOJK_014788 [Asimina triloba]
MIVSPNRKNNVSGELIESMQHGRCCLGGSPWAVHCCLTDGSGAVHYDRNGFSDLKLGASDAIDCVGRWQEGRSDGG